MRYFFFPLLLACTYLSYGQVGINNAEPKATLDIKAGTSSSADGILIPRVSRLRSQEMNNIENSTLIYINSLNGTQSGVTSDVNSVGFYYFNTSKWVKLEGADISAENGIYESNGVIKLGGLLTEVTTIDTRDYTLKLNNIKEAAYYIDAVLGIDSDNVVKKGKIAFSNGLNISSDISNSVKLGGDLNVNTDLTTNGKNLTFNVSNDQLYIKGLNEGLASDAIGNGGILMIDNNGRVKKTSEIADDLSIPVPSVFVLETNVENFLANADWGDKQAIGPFKTIKDGIDGLVYNAGAAPTVTLPRGVYQLTWVYEVDTTELLTNECTISSYFIDFPTDVGNVRVHTTSAHYGSIGSYRINHGGIVTYTTVLENTTIWPLAFGRGQSGNCLNTPNLNLKANSTQITIFKLGDPD